MTPAAILRLAVLASTHTLTEPEILLVLRTARATHPTTITVDAIADAIATVIATREAHAA